MICVDKEDPATVYVALKNKLMNAYDKDWGLEDAVRLLKRFIDALGEDLPVVADYVNKIKLQLEEKKDDVDFNRLQAFFLLSMCLSKPHQVLFDRKMKTIKDTKNSNSTLSKHVAHFLISFDIFLL